jgi:hypothetical protein
VRESQQNTNQCDSYNVCLVSMHVVYRHQDDKGVSTKGFVVLFCLKMLTALVQVEGFS